MFQFKLSDNGKKQTKTYEKSKSSTHKRYFMKDQANRVWEENKYAGDAVFGGKNFFELIAELNKSPAELKTLNCTPVEFGQKLYKGTTKIIKKVDGKIVNVELKFPEILEDDERIWKNRKPLLVGDADVLLPDNADVACECDECLESQELEMMTKEDVTSKPHRKITRKLAPEEKNKARALEEMVARHKTYAEFKAQNRELEDMANQDITAPTQKLKKTKARTLKHMLYAYKTYADVKTQHRELQDMAKQDISLEKTLKHKTTTNKTMKRAPVTNLIKQYLESGLPVLDGFSEKQLSDMLLKANSEYHSSKKPIMSDAQYDILRNYIEEKYPNNEAIQQIGAPVKGAKNKVTLPFNMPSMDKIKPETTALTNWTLKYTGPYVISCKLDGVSGMYSMDAAGAKLYTRGDGSVGQDISHLIKLLGLPTIPVGTVVRGEFIMPKTTFDAKYKDEFSNPRNFVAGLINAKTMRAGIKDLEFIVYEMIQPALSPSKQMEQLVKHGFDVVQHETFKTVSKDLLTQTLMSWRATNKYEIDGIIVADDHVYPRTAKNPEHAFAFKMAINDQIAETEVVDVIWEASQDGYLKPRVKIVPVSIGGVNIEYTTGFNGKFIEDNKIGPGAKIQMIRSGDVIPYIKSVLIPAARGKMPDAEETPYEWNATHVDIVLKNAEDNDTVKEKNIVGFFSDLEVDGLATGNVRRIMAAGFDTVPKILKMSEGDFKHVEGFKSKMIEKVRNSIKEKVGAASIVQLMAASNKFGRGMGVRVLTPLMDANHDFLTKDESKAEKIAKLHAAGIHKNAEAFYNNIPAFNEFMRECGLDATQANTAPKVAVAAMAATDKSNPLYEKSIVMTKIRDKEIIEHLKIVGATLEDSFKKNTVALVVKDKSDVTNKVRDAEKKGIEILTVEEFKAKYMA